MPPRAVNLAPAACGQQRSDAGADQGKRRRQYVFAFVSGADNRVWRTIVVNRDARAESPARSNRCADQRMLASMAVHFEGKPPNRSAGVTWITARTAQHASILVSEF